jgi:hypothetical protein
MAARNFEDLLQVGFYLYHSWIKLIQRAVLYTRLRPSPP